MKDQGIVVSTIQPSAIALEQSLTAERTLTIAWLDTGRRHALHEIRVSR
jgi:hypothetical protein